MFTGHCFANNHVVGIRESPLHNTIYCQTCEDQRVEEVLRGARAEPAYPPDHAETEFEIKDVVDGDVKGAPGDVYENPRTSGRCVGCDGAATHRVKYRAGYHGWIATRLCTPCLNRNLRSHGARARTTIVIERLHVEETVNDPGGVEGQREATDAPAGGEGL